MADRNGYIGRAPADSSIVIARQEYSPSGVTTDFTFNSGYTVGYIDAYLNGVRQIEASDYTATDGSTVSLTTAAESGDTLELVAYKAFNATNVTDASGNFTVGTDLTVGGSVGITSNVNCSGIVTAGEFSGDGSSLTGITTGVSINAAGGALQRVMLGNVTSGVANTLANTGSLYWNDNTSTLYATNVNISGTTTTEDTQNVDSTGIVTAGLGFRATKGGLVITAGVSTFTPYPAIDANEEVQVGTAIQLGKAGIVTALGLDISTGGVDIDGQLDADELVVAGVATFSAAIDANSTSDFADTLNVSGGTFKIGTGVTIAAVAGLATFSSGVKLTAGDGGLLSEGISSVTAGFDNTSDLNLDDGMVHYTSDAIAGNANTLNLTSSAGINTAMGVNDMIVVTGITSVSSTSHYVNELTIDHNKVRQISWVGGAAPTEGGSTGFDVYTFTVWKTGNAQFMVIANQTTTTA